MLQKVINIDTLKPEIKIEILHLNEYSDYTEGTVFFLKVTPPSV